MKSLVNFDEVKFNESSYVDSSLNYEFQNRKSRTYVRIFKI